MNIDLDYRSSTVYCLWPRVLDSAAALRAALVAVAMEGQRSALSRWCLRVVARDDAARAVARASAGHILGLEARVPLGGELAGYALLFYAYNRPERVNSPAVHDAFQSMLAEIDAMPRKPYSEIMAPLDTGLVVERLLMPVANDDYAQLLSMYRAAFSDYLMPVELKLASLLTDPVKHRLMIGRSPVDGRVLAACAASETVLTRADGGRVRLWELGKSVKRAGAAAGINGALKMVLLQQAAAAGVDLVYCETRLALRAPNQINHRLGMRYYGQLTKALRVHGAEDIAEHELDGSAYKSLGLWALARRDLEAGLGGSASLHQVQPATLRSLP